MFPFNPNTELNKLCNYNEKLLFYKLQLIRNSESELVQKSRMPEKARKKLFAVAESSREFLISSIGFVCFTFIKWGSERNGIERDRKKERERTVGDFVFFLYTSVYRPKWELLIRGNSKRNGTNVFFWNFQFHHERFHFVGYQFTRQNHKNGNFLKTTSLGNNVVNCTKAVKFSSADCVTFPLLSTYTKNFASSFSVSAALNCKEDRMAFIWSFRFCKKFSLLSQLFFLNQQAK